MRTSFKSLTIGALGSAACLLLSAGNLQAQDGPPQGERPPQGNFDPAQMRQRMLDRMREQMEVKDDTEWKAIAERVEKVMQARRDMGGAGAPGGMGFSGGQGGRGGPGGFAGRGRPGGPPQDGQDGLPPQGGPGGQRPQRGQGRPDNFGPPDGAAGRGPDAAGGGGGGRGGFRNGPGGFGGPGGMPRQASPELEALRKALDSDAPASEIKAKLADVRAARKKKEAELEKAQEALKEVLSARQEAVAVTMGLLQ